MKQKLFIGLIFLLFSITLYAQNDYIQYYQLINKVKKYQANNKNDSLTIFLKQAFEMVDYVHIENLKLARRIAKKQHDRELLNYSKKALKSSKDNINLNLKAKLDSVGKEDQRVRGRKYYNAKKYYAKCLYDTTFNYDEKKRLKSKELMEEWWRVDSSNAEFVKKVILKYGFPSEKIVGQETNSMVSIILLHYDKDTANHIMGESLEIALKEGSITPIMYAWIIDRHLMNAGKEQKYYMIPTHWEKMTNKKRIEYNKNRFSIGLKTLDDIKIKVKKNSVKVSYRQ